MLLNATECFQDTWKNIQIMFINLRMHSKFWNNTIANVLQMQKKKYYNYVFGQILNIYWQKRAKIILQ